MYHWYHAYQNLTICSKKDNPHSKYIAREYLENNNYVEIYKISPFLLQKRINNDKRVCGISHNFPKCEYALQVY